MKHIPGSRRYYPLVTLVFVLAASFTAFAQAGDPGPIRSSAAYAEVLLRKTELLADLEALTPDYTEANPRILDLRAELASLDHSLEKVFGVKPGDTGKLTTALGKIIVRKAVIDAEFARASRSFNKDHPDVKRAKRRLETFDKAINEILR